MIHNGCNTAINKLLGERDGLKLQLRESVYLIDHIVDDCDVTVPEHHATELERLREKAGLIDTNDTKKCVCIFEGSVHHLHSMHCPEYKVCGAADPFSTTGLMACDHSPEHKGKHSWE